MTKTEASNKYNKENCLRVSLVLNKETDSDIIEFLGTQPSKMGYLKDLIRKDMEEKEIATKRLKEGWNDITEELSIFVEDDGSIPRGVKNDVKPVYPYKAVGRNEYSRVDDLNIKNWNRRKNSIVWL